MYSKDDLWLLIQQSDRAVKRAMILLYRDQTSEEQEVENTITRNGRGFNSWDASFGSDMAKLILGRSVLSPRQLIACRKLLKKYCGQLSRVWGE